MHRMFHPRSKRCLCIALDHGATNEMDLLPGLEDMGTVINTVVKANPDALLLAPGEASKLQAVPLKEKPSLMLRVDVTNGYHGRAPDIVYCHVYEHAVEMALRLDATCVTINLFDYPGHTELNSMTVTNVLKIKSECERYGMPLMLEAMMFKKQGPGSYENDLALDKVLPVVRQAAELGADIVKADPTDNLDDYHKVVEAAGVPILVRGGSKMPDLDVLKMTEKLIQQNVGGLAYGRNVIQHPHPDRMTQALKAIVHDRKSAVEALKIIEG
jgi:DhnA family fructose-bisphosphate aldolase class Ia